MLFVFDINLFITNIILPCYIVRSRCFPPPDFHYAGASFCVIGTSSTTLASTTVVPVLVFSIMEIMFSAFAKAHNPVFVLLFLLQ